MTPIDRLSPIAGTSPLGSVAGDAAQGAAREAMGQIGHRVMAWIDAIAPTPAPKEAWTRLAGPSDGFRPDASELGRGGDVYGLGQLADDVAARFGGSPAQTGELHRALEDFTRAAVVHLVGVADADPADRLGALAAAVDITADAAGPAGGMDAVIDAVRGGTAQLARE